LQARLTQPGLLFYFTSLLLLMGRLNALRSREKWEAKRVFSGSNSEFDLARSVFVVVAVLVIFSWMLPGPPGWQRRPKSSTCAA